MVSFMYSTINIPILPTNLNGIRDRMATNCKYNKLQLAIDMYSTCIMIQFVIKEQALASELM